VTAMLSENKVAYVIATKFGTGKMRLNKKWYRLLLESL